MKKIVSAAIIAAMVVGSVFADVKISGNYRIGTNLVNMNMPGDDTKEDTQVFNDMEKTAWGDNVTFEWKDENAGVKLLFKTSESSLAMDYGFGWLKFGALKLYGGTQDVRGAIKRVNPLDGNWWNNFCEYGKPGVHKDLAVLGLDSGNVTGDQKGKKAVNIMGEYAIADNMNARLALFKNEKSEGSMFDSINVAAQFDMKQDLFNLAATFKYGKNDTETSGTAKEDTGVMSLGLFVNPIVVDGLDMLVGFTYAKAESESFETVADNAVTAVDFRASYKVDAWTLSSLNNFTFVDGDMATWNTLGAAYKVNDVITAAGVQAIFNSTKGTWDDDANTSDYMKVRPYIDLTAQKNAVLSIGLEIGVKNFMGEGDQDMTVTVPTVMRVKL